MMNFNNPYFYGQQQHHHHQQQQFHQQPRNFYLPPPTFSLPPFQSTSSNFSTFGNGSGGAPMPPPPATMNNSSIPSYISLSNDGTVKEESAREVFFRTLSTSLKEANKFYSGKTTTWKNPFLYKTTLCENYCARSYCRYGVNCWYAHGIHELRCIPESEDLPDPNFIAQYLSFLGLPKQALENIINHAYHTATLYTELKWYMASKKSSDLQSFASTRSDTTSTSSPPKYPTKAEQQQPFAIVQSSTSSSTEQSPVAARSSSNPITIPKPTAISSNTSLFCSSVASNGGNNEWNSLCSAINGLGFNDENTFKGPGPSDNNSFGKSFRLFGESYPLKPGNA